MHESSIITNANDDQLKARRELFNLMSEYPATREELERSLGLFQRRIHAFNTFTGGAARP